MEKFANFAWRMGMKPKHLSRKIRHPDCPQNFEAREGASGRIIELRPTPELEQFIRTDQRHNMKKHIKQTILTLAVVLAIFSQATAQDNLTGYDKLAVPSVTQFKIVSAHNVLQFQLLVEQLLADGWQLQGNPFTTVQSGQGTPVTFYQAAVR
jgi:hypothetical protein